MLQMPGPAPLRLCSVSKYLRWVLCRKAAASPLHPPAPLSSARGHRHLQATTLSHQTPPTSLRSRLSRHHITHSRECRWLPSIACLLGRVLGPRYGPVALLLQLASPPAFPAGYMPTATHI